MLTLYLVRHGQTEWNRQERYQGKTDIPLDDTGRDQARRLAARLAPHGPRIVYSSDLVRAVETARIIAEAAGCPVRTTPQLRERGYGRWEGLTRREIEERDGLVLQHYTIDPIHISPPEGESHLSVRDRVMEALRQIQAETPDGAAVVVGHGGSLRWFVVDALGAPVETSLRLRWDNASVSIVEYHESGPRLVLFNDRSHL
jgi:broad specificity phosphatase PhoE